MDVFVSKTLYTNFMELLEIKNNDGSTSETKKVSITPSMFLLQELQRHDVEDFDIQPCKDFGLDPILQVHCPDYIQFIQKHLQECQLKGKQVEKKLLCYAHARLLHQTMTPTVNRLANDVQIPRPVSTYLYGYYFFDDTLKHLTSEMYDAAYWSVQAALTATSEVLEGTSPVMAVCEALSHHAGRNLSGGQCLFNAAAVAAKYIINKTRNSSIVTILDMNFDHGSGTQSLFYDERNPCVISIHTEQAYPWYTGKETEKGLNLGYGSNINHVLPAFATSTKYLHALQKAIETIKDNETQYLIVNMGAGILEGDESIVLTIDDMEMLARKITELCDEDVKVLLLFQSATISETQDHSDHDHMTRHVNKVCSFVVPFSEQLYYDLY